MPGCRAPGVTAAEPFHALTAHYYTGEEGLIFAEKAGREGRLEEVRQLLPELEAEFATVRHLMEDSLLA